jgi:hypothetical protein
MTVISPRMEEPFRQLFRDTSISCTGWQSPPTEPHPEALLRQGSLTVTGNYTQSAGAALTEQFGSTLHVNLNATLSGALKRDRQPQTSPAFGRDLHRLAVASISGSFTSHTAGFTLTTGAISIIVRKQ